MDVVIDRPVDPGSEPETEVAISDDLEPLRLRRLTESQYRRAVQVLLAVPDEVIGALPGDAAREEDAELSNVGAGQQATSAYEVELYEAAAWRSARYVFRDAARRAALLGSASLPADAEWTRAFVERFGRSAWRRPLTPSELDRYQKLALAPGQGQNDNWLGLEAFVAALLQSPHFTYLVESRALARALPKYRDYVMASRLSFFLWDSPPDAELLAAVADGRLASHLDVLDRAAEMLQSPRFRAGSMRFFREWLGLDALATLAKDPDIYPELPRLAPALQQELEALVERQAFTPGASLLDLFTTRQAFVDSNLAQFYQVRLASAGPAWVTLPQASKRSGFLTRAGFLAMTAHRTQTSATRRGLFIRERLLCDTIPPPPSDVSIVLPEEPSDQPQTLRERLKEHVESPTCASCHQLMDPLGLALEHFDALGRYRATDRGLALDVHGDLAGEAFDGPNELSRLLTKNQDLAACVSSQLLSYATGAPRLPKADRAIHGLRRAFAESGYRFDALVRAVVASELFNRWDIAAGPATSRDGMTVQSREDVHHAIVKSP